MKPLSHACSQDVQRSILATSHLLALLAFFAALGARADGLPYGENGSLSCPAIILIMNDVQFAEVDTRRKMTLTDDQKRMLRRLFKSVPDRLDIVSSTFNDSIEDASLFNVHAIWLRDRMIALTYQGNYNEPADKQFWEQATFTAFINPERLIISSTSRVFREGKEISYADVIRLIDELAKTAKDGGATGNEAPFSSPGRLNPDAPVAVLRFSLPPSNDNVSDPEITPAALLESFRVYASTKSIGIHKDW